MAAGTLGILGALGGGLMQASAAKKAANAQTKAANQDIAFQKETRDQIRADLAPWVQGGTLGNQAQMNMLGLGAAPMIGGTAPQVETYQIPGAYTPSVTPGHDRGDGPPSRFANPTGGSYGEPTTGYRVNGQDFATLQEAQNYANANQTGGTPWEWQQTPGYQFRMDQGLDALDASAAARGGLYSGAAMQDALKFGQDYASNEYGNIFNMLGGLSTTGMNAAGMNASAAQNTANGVSNALAGIGNAQAAGAIGGANAWSNALGDAYGVWNYQKQMGGGANGNGNGYNWLFGGPGLGGFS
jgi:hypothetical protein